MINIINQRKSWFFEKVNQIDQHLAKVTRRENTEIKREMLQQISLKSTRLSGSSMKTVLIRWSTSMKWKRLNACDLHKLKPET